MENPTCVFTLNFNRCGMNVSKMDFTIVVVRIDFIATKVSTNKQIDLITIVRFSFKNMVDTIFSSFFNKSIYC